MCTRIRCSVNRERTGRKKPSTYPGETACGKNPGEPACGKNPLEVREHRRQPGGEMQLVAVYIQYGVVRTANGGVGGWSRL